MIYHLRYLIGFFLSASLLASCGDSPFYSEVKQVEVSGWEMNEKIPFKVNIDDTVSLHNIFLNLRHRRSYDYSNIYFFVYIHFPNGKMSKDTVECTLADLQGRWLGSKAGDLVSHEVMIKYRAQFPLAGEYHFEVQHAMREEELLDVSDVGIKIEIVD
jgi:gliding motility-associated lipoprotein GldH